MKSCYKAFACSPGGEPQYPVHFLRQILLQLALCPRDYRGADNLSLASKAAGWG